MMMMETGLETGDNLLFGKRRGSKREQDRENADDDQWIILMHDALTCTDMISIPRSNVS